MASKRKRFDPMGGLRSPPTPDPDDEPGPTLEDQFQRLEQARKTIEATFWYLEVEAPEAPPFRQGLLGKRFVIGRDPGSNLPLRGAGISRQHALLEHDEERDCWRISDAGSHNGTYVNGRRVREPTLLGPADTIHVGDWRLRLRADSNEDRRELLRFATLRMQTPPLPGVGGRPPTPKPDRLIVLSGPAPRKEIRLDEGPVRLGPVKGSSLVPRGGALPDLDLEVRPLPEPGTYELVVRGEGGPPVVVNEAPVRKLRLSPGDRLRLGQANQVITLEFRAGDPALRRRSSAPPKAEGPSSETTPTETKRIDVEALANAARAADAAARRAAAGRANATKAPKSDAAGAEKADAPNVEKADAPSTDEAAAPRSEKKGAERTRAEAPSASGGEGKSDPEATQPQVLYVERGGKLEPVPWAAELGLSASPSEAPPREDDPTPEPSRSLPARPSAPKRRTMGIVIVLALGVIGLIAAAMTRLQSEAPPPEGAGSTPDARTRTAALKTPTPPSASGPSEALTTTPSAPRANEASSAPNANEAPAPSATTPASSTPPSAPGSAWAPRPGALAPHALTAAAPPPRPASSGKRKPHGPARESVDPESEARMREFLCRQKGKCD